MKKVSLISFALLLTVSTTQAAKKASDDLLETLGDSIGKSTTATGKYIAEAEAIIAFGEKVYNIFERGETTYEIQEVEPVSILPKVNGIAVEPFQMDSWGELVSQDVNLSVVKAYGSKDENGVIQQKPVSKLIFSIVFRPNGKYEGKGNYLTDLVVIPKFVDPGFLMGVEANVSVINVANVGSAVNPLAEAIIRIQVKARNKFLAPLFPHQQAEASYLYSVRGNGNVSELNGTTSLVK